MLNSIFHLVCSNTELLFVTFFAIIRHTKSFPSAYPSSMYYVFTRNTVNISIQGSHIYM